MFVWVNVGHMTARELVRAIGAKSPFLDGLARSEVNAVLAAARYLQYPAGAVVAVQGTPASSMFLLLKGRARFFILTPRGNKILLLWLPEGEIFGVSAILSQPFDYIVSTETLIESTILVWDRPAIRELAMRYPRLLDNALLAAREYLTFYVAAHIAFTSHNAKQRLAGILLHLSQGIGRAVSRGIELDVTNEELAQAANVTPFTASRLISAWQKKGVLIKARGKVVLLSPAKLLLPAA